MINSLHLAILNMTVSKEIFSSSYREDDCMELVKFFRGFAPTSDFLLKPEQMGIQLYFKAPILKSSTTLRGVQLRVTQHRDITK